MRTGALAYVVVAVLGLALLTITGIVLMSNQISDRKAEKSSLESQLSAAQAEADRTKSFADFAALQLSREQTVASLAQSRFDWERVLRELAIVIPHDVWLTSLNASVSQDAATSSASSSSSSGSSAGSESITGPSLQIEGCAGGHEAVARFLAALGDVDGVTRVSVLKSDRPDAGSLGETATAASSGTTAGSEGCSSRDFVSQFEVVAAFDAVQVDPSDPGDCANHTHDADRDFDHDGRRPEPGRRCRAAASAAEGLGRTEDREGPQGRGHVHPRDRGGAMRRKEHTILLSLAIIGLIVAVWLVVLAPKRDQAASLKQDVDQLQSQLGAGAAGGRRGSAGAEVVPGRLPEAGRAGQGGARRTATRRASWSSCSSSPTAPEWGSNRSTWRTPQARRPPPPRRPPRRRVPRAQRRPAPPGPGTRPPLRLPPRPRMPVRRGPPEACRRSPSLTATEASAATLPIGASIGPAGLAE